ncbi:hypothetical protein MSG28_001404 [Choristoneura fumiferana]|uniref:Uncharacterized protein n=1 Tax=Choristoneura fumiferana TaxID=7141 RepID=A0ACC0KTS6_CHOFU|nr:hypothetical protein MSG28_001404 [Choristoneura fumiferana]
MASHSEVRQPPTAASSGEQWRATLKAVTPPVRREVASHGEGRHRSPLHRAQVRGYKVQAHTVTVSIVFGAPEPWGDDICIPKECDRGCRIGGWELGYCVTDRTCGCNERRV